MPKDQQAPDGQAAGRSGAEDKQALLAELGREEGAGSTHWQGESLRSIGGDARGPGERAATSTAAAPGLRRLGELAKGGGARAVIWGDARQWRPERHCLRRVSRARVTGSRARGGT